MNKIRLEKITKSIKNDIVLSDISMELESGKIYGIVGKNGSGKSMLFRAMAGLIHINSGKIYLNEKLVKKDLTQELRVGLILENINLHLDLSAMENLTYLAKINGYITKENIVQSLQRVDLDSDNKKKVKTYSLGMRQKLIIAQAIMEQPELLLLDEPTNALDEGSVERFRRIIKEEADRGAIVVIASHNQNDIDMLCNEVYFMKNGVLSKEEQ